MERGDTGLGRDAYGLPGRERDRRGYGPGPYPSDDGYPASAGEDDAAGPGRPADAEEDDYGQLLRRPGEMPPRQQRLREPGRPYPGQPGRFPPGAVLPGAVPPGVVSPNGVPGHGGMPGSGVPGGGVPYGTAPGGPAGPGVPHGGYPDGSMPHGPMPYGAPSHGTASHGAASHGAPSHGAPPHGGPPQGGPPNGGPPNGRQYRLPNGRRVPPEADRLYRPPGPSVPGGTSGQHHGPGRAAQDPYPDTWSRPQPPLREHPPAGPRFGAPDGRERLGPPLSPPLSPLPEPPGPVIRQRETAVPEDRPGGPAQPAASIEPDGLEAFARDLRALRAKADLDYPEMADASHYEMKTLAAAAGGLRLPTLPVAVAFVRACDGNVAEWEERWQKLAEKITADAARKRKNDGEEIAEPLEPAGAPAALEPPALKPAAPPPPDPDGGEVYVITSAKPRQPGW